MESTHTLVSFSIPINNLPEGLKQLLYCMLAQTYPNLVIMVSDNASPNSDVKNASFPVGMLESLIAGKLKTIGQ